MDKSDLTPIGVLVLAYIGTWLGFDMTVIQGFKELFGMDITTSGYYLIALIIGVLFAFFK